jgi:hypothetical protein
VLPDSEAFEAYAAVADARAYYLAAGGSIAAQRPAMRAILAAVAERFGVALNDLLSRRRQRGLAVPRHLAIALCKRLTMHSLPEIGRRAGGRDHTTILHSVMRAEAALDACGLSPDAPLVEWVEALYRVTRGGVTLDVGGKKDAEA